MSDFNFHTDLIDGKMALERFVRCRVTEPGIAKLPFMSDSSKALTRALTKALTLPTMAQLSMGSAQRVTNRT